jgi:hypothetical protein
MKLSRNPVLSQIRRTVAAPIKAHALQCLVSRLNHLNKGNHLEGWLTSDLQPHTGPNKGRLP